MARMMERRFALRWVPIVAGVVALSACASSSATLPQPRSVITVTGARLNADPQAMFEVN